MESKCLLVTSFSQLLIHNDDTCFFIAIIYLFNVTFLNICPTESMSMTYMRGMHYTLCSKNQFRSAILLCSGLEKLSSLEINYGFILF